jgi:hypothetical protein
VDFFFFFFFFGGTGGLNSNVFLFGRGSGFVIALKVEIYKEWNNSRLMGHSFTGSHCLLLGWQMILCVFITVRMKCQLLDLTWGAYPQKHAKGHLTRGGWKLSLGFLSECVGVAMAVCIFSFSFDMIDFCSALT